MELFAITVEIKKEDISALCEYILKRRKVRSVILYIFLIALFILIFRISHIDLYLSIGMSLALVAIFGSTMTRLTRSRYSSQFNSNKNFREPIIYHIYEDHYRVKTATSESEVDWASRYDIRQDNDYIYIFHLRELASLIPKRYLDAEQVSFFEKLILKYGKK